MNVTKNVTDNELLNDLINQAEVISTKLQDAVNTKAATGYTSTNTSSSSTAKMENVQSVVTVKGNCNWTMIIQRESPAPYYASDATMPSDASEIVS